MGDRLGAGAADRQSVQQQRVQLQMDDDELLRSLVKIPIEWDDKLSSTEHDCFPKCIELWGLPEHLFHKLTNSSCNSKHIEDATGTRPYSGALVFLEFCRVYSSVFLDQQYRLVELGAGIGTCGLILALAKRNAQTLMPRPGTQLVSPSCNNSAPGILLTDGEKLATQIAQRNATLLGLSPREVLVDILRWTEDVQEIQKIASLHSFHYVVGTDLLYYRSPARALITTAEALLAKQDKYSPSQHGIVESLPYEGAIFLPAIIRTPLLAQEIIDVCSDLNLEIQVLPIESFYQPINPMMYNVSFLVVSRKGVDLHPALAAALRDAHPFTANEDSDNEEILPLSF